MQTAHHNSVLSYSSLKGTTVKTPRDEKIGKIEDLMIDTSSGEVVYAVLSVDTGFLNLNTKYFAVPLQAFAFDTAQDDIIILDVDKDRLENSPGFDKDNWPVTPQVEFFHEVHSYYGLDTYRDRNVL